jgi:molybdopterin synthase catalytic subunit
VRVKVLFFGLLRDITGRSGEELDLPSGATLGSIFDRYSREYPRILALSKTIVLAHNHAFADRSTAVAEGDEVAFLPPVSGGSDVFTRVISGEPEGCFFALTRSPIDTAALSRRILRGEDGAVVNFEGVVRNNTAGRQTLALEYECYEDMAVKIMAGIGAAIASSHPIGRIAMVHRLGRLEIGEASVAVLVTAPHRKPAFDAALEGINRLKKLVPIWKKEYFAGGEVWVDGEWDQSVLS